MAASGGASPAPTGSYGPSKAGAPAAPVVKPAKPGKPTMPSFAPSGSKFSGPKSPGAGWRGISGGWWAPPKASGNPGKGKGGGGATTGTGANNPLYDPSKTLSGKSLLAAATALADAQTKPAIQGLRQQLSESNQTEANQAKTLNGYFQGLGGLDQQSAGQSRDIASGLNSTLAGIGGQEQNALQGVSQNAQDMMGRYNPGDPSLAAAGMTSLTQELARQQGLAAQNAGTFRATGALQGASGANMAVSNAQAGTAAGRADLSKLSSNLLVKQAPLTQKIAQLQAQRGSLISTDAGKLRQQEITNQFTRQGLGLKSQSNQITAANDAAKNAIASGQLTINQQKLTEQTAKDKATSDLGWARLSVTQQNDLANQAIRQAAQAAKSGGSRRLSQKANNTMQALLDTAIAAIPNLQKAGASEQDIRNALSSGTVKAPNGSHVSKIPSLLVQAAYELRGYGYITPQTAQAMHQLGMYQNTFNNGPIRVANAPGQAAGAGAGVGAGLGGVGGAASGNVG